MSDFPSSWRLHNAARWVKAGGVIAYPTEAVFGLGCDPGNRAAVTRLLAIKERRVEKGLILVASDWHQLAHWLEDIPAALRQRLDRSWPGPVTWLIPAAKSCPAWLRGKHAKLAVRITDHALVRQLCRLLDSAIVSTSANRSGQRPARSLLEVRLQFGQQIDFILPGPLGTLAGPTEIRDLESGRVIRKQAG
ncbi:MAG: Sua5/YciO/YrdC/YwlC family protein [Thiogranum sp.]|nr:Sua5/YciO/YrdC/YwlC family protein [Thiogranum sp.]